MKVWKRALSWHLASEMYKQRNKTISQAFTLSCNLLWFSVAHFMTIVTHLITLIRSVANKMNYSDIWGNCFDLEKNGFGDTCCKMKILILFLPFLHQVFIKFQKIGKHTRIIGKFCSVKRGVSFSKTCITEHPNH